MNLFAQERIDKFYQWEHVGRGKLIDTHPVPLEPPFEPFETKRIFKPIVDDGRIPTIFNRLSKALKNKTKTPVKQTATTPSLPTVSQGSLITYVISIPKELKIRITEVQEFLLMLFANKIQVAFEIIATSANISVQFTCNDNEIVKNQLKAFFPSCSITKNDCAPIFEPSGEIAASDFYIQQEFLKSIRVVENFEIDPSAALYSIFDSINESEMAVFQVLFTGTTKPWRESLIRSVTNYTGDCIFLDAPELLKQAKEKVSDPLFAVSIRTAIKTKSYLRSKQLLAQINAAVIGMSKSASNSLGIFQDKAYNLNTKIVDINLRQSHRSGMLLSSRELMNFCHLPGAAIYTLKLNRRSRKTKVAPTNTKAPGLFLGVNDHHGLLTDVYLPDEIKGRHTFICGGTGSGKSNLQCHMIINDIKRGNGVIVLDPHGSLIDDLLNLIPQERIDDVILFDPSDSEFPFGLNILKADSDIEKQVLASDLTTTFRRLSTSFGDQMYSVLANAIMSFVENPNGGTLVDLRRFLVEKQFRDEFLTNVPDPAVQFYWKKEYPLLKTTSTGPILTRLDTFLRPRIIRNIVGQKSGLSFDELISSNNIFLAKLPIGLIGNENSLLLGTLIVTKVLQAAMGNPRAEKPANYSFYIDECQNYCSVPSLISLLQSVRKYGLSLILATQSLNSLDRDLSSTIIANTATKIFFRLGEVDAKAVSEGFTFFNSTEDFLNLNVGEAIVKVERADCDFNLKTFLVEKSKVDKNCINDIINRSRKKYNASRISVEENILTSLNDTQKREIKGFSSSKEKKGNDIENPVFIQGSSPGNSEAIANIEVSKKAKEVIEKKIESQHRYIQNLIKRVAEANGYKALIEAPIFGENGKIDVLLERETTIAIEVSISTPPDWEVNNNISKCLGRYTEIISCVASEKMVDIIKKKIQVTFSEHQVKNIKVFTVDELIIYLNKKCVINKSHQKTIKGYKVKIEYEEGLTDKEIKQKQESLAEIILSSSKK